MDRLEKIEARRLILSWKDRWSQTIQQRLEIESRQLQSELHAKIDQISFGMHSFPAGICATPFSRCLQSGAKSRQRN